MFASDRRERRVRLAEAFQRESVFKARTVELLRGRADKKNPEFVRAFMAAKQARRDVERHLRLAARVESVEQKARALQARVEAQAAVRGVLDRHRRFTRADFAEALDAAEDALVAGEDRLDDAAALDEDWAGGGDPDEDEGEEADGALLTQWLLEEAAEA
ncbi:UL14 [Suid alphaherpesvirus 1]|uniref:UL14 n=1 Tax=Suid herpesvirus 1 TaxID=10345 RepID=Q80PY8_SUHV|nr:UL14 [Suid alphaherpesvirus 1]AKG94073.1 UL14 protein [Suid alphaherpesvirus 1]AML81155.1 UL14 [Suid alphaherpesvirus 1]ANZ03072.1 UL14 protein [Suid alphaherpesvirus 1]ARJ55476.1 UL14 [Suid alphaherpesvirus 1]